MPRRASASSSGVTSHGPNELAKSLPLAGPSRTAVSSRWRSRADQSLKIVKPPIASSARSGGRSDAGVSISGRDLELVVELVRRGRRPDRLVRPADLRDVAEVEDREPEPRLRDLAAAPLPHRPDVALERVEVADRGRPQDRRPERDVGGGEHGVVVLVARLEAVEQVAQRLDAQPAREVLVEGRHRLAEEDRVVREGGSRADRAPARDLEVEPATRCLPASSAAASRHGAPGGRVSFADVGDLHAGQSSQRSPPRRTMPDVPRLQRKSFSGPDQVRKFSIGPRRHRQPRRDLGRAVRLGARLALVGGRQARRRHAVVRQSPSGLCDRRAPPRPDGRRHGDGHRGRGCLRDPAGSRRLDHRRRGVRLGRVRQRAPVRDRPGRGGRADAGDDPVHRHRRFDGHAGADSATRRGGACCWTTTTRCAASSTSSEAARS